MNNHALIEPPSNAAQMFLTSFELKALFGGRSDMWLWRHAKTLPKPVIIGGRRYYPKDEVEACRQRLLAGRDGQPARVKAGGRKKRNNSK